MVYTSFSRERSSLARIIRTLGHGWEFVRAIVQELQRATAAAHRFQELKQRAASGNNPAGDAARRIYQEFYADL
jgi:hypothetical protein